MLVIPIQPLPSQTVDVVLNEQACSIKIYQRSTGLFVDLDVQDVLVIGGVIAHDRNRIVRSDYLGFVGDIAFVDMQGTDDPDYTGLGDRFILAYFFPDELTAAPTVVPLWTPTGTGTVTGGTGGTATPPGAPGGLSIT